MNGCSAESLTSSHFYTSTHAYSIVTKRDTFDCYMTHQIHDAHTYTHIHIHTHKHSHTHTHTHRHQQMHCYRRIWDGFDTHTHTLHTIIHRHIYTDTHIYTYTYIHTHRLGTICDRRSANSCACCFNFWFHCVYNCSHSFSIVAFSIHNTHI